MIVKREDVKDISKLKNHKNVTMFVGGPRDYIFFEYYDEIFLKRWNGPPEVRNDPELLDRLNQIEMEMQDLLSPLYSKVDDQKNIFMTGMHLFIEDTLFDHPTIKRRRYVNLKHDSRKAPSLHGLKFSVKFKKCDDKYKKTYEKTLSEWAAWAKENGYLKKISPIVYVEEDVGTVRIDFESKASVCIVALFMLLNDMKSKNAIDYLSFY
jgi:hypothetical protein